MRVLVVDDDLEFLELAATVLRHAGAEFRAVSSAALAHGLLETWLPNVVLTGPMLASALRASFIGQQLAVPIVALTASGTRESCALFARAEFDLYLTKPVDPVELALAVGAVVRREA
jgi:DNA-binding response OmpR family regulator